MKKQISFILFLLVSIAFISFATALPNGAVVEAGISQRGDVTSPQQDDNAYAGNITELNVSGVSITQSWQGYFGNVTGSITLNDALDHVLYNWSATSPSGEVYASNSSTINWDGIMCYSNANNLTYFENMFGIKTGDMDGIDETFNLNNHPEFYTNQKQFTAGSCNNVELYNQAGIGTFNEVLLTDGLNIVFTSILLEDVVGFDSNPHDFEMIVLEDGHGTDTSTTTYYFWVELE